MDTIISRRAHRTTVRSASLLDAVRSVRPDLGNALVPSAAVDVLAPIAGLLPAEATDCFYLEARLGAGEKEVDLGLLMNQAGLRFLAGEGERRLPPQLSDTLPWDRVQRYAAAALEPGATFRGGDGSEWPDLGKLWLGFDSQREDVTVPCVYTGMRGTSHGSVLSCPEPVRSAWYRRRIEQSLRAFGFTLPASVHREIDRVCAALPEGGLVADIAVMMQRELRALRVGVVPITAEEAAPLLARLGWDGDVGQVDDVLSDLTEGYRQGPHLPYPKLYLHLDVWESVLPRVGVEFLFRRSPQLAGSIQEAPWFDKLSRWGLADRSKIESLTSWPGVAVHVDRRRAWRPGTVLRRLNHVKVVFSEGGVGAKAYVRVDSGRRPTRGHGRVGSVDSRPLPGTVL